MRRGRQVQGTVTVALFVSTYANKVDKKGRVSVPATFRKALEAESFNGIFCFESLSKPCLQGGGQSYIEMLQAAIDLSQEKVAGTVRLKLYKGNAMVVGRKSDASLYSEAHVTFEDDAGAYDQKDAEGFIKLNALRLRLLAKRDR